MFRDDELDADDDDEECDNDVDGYGTYGLGSYTSNIPQSSHWKTNIETWHVILIL